MHYHKTSHTQYATCLVLLPLPQVYDIAFSRAGGGRDMFASVGADGSVRMFDLRHLEHSTIIYEDPQHHPLLRLAWNKQDPNYLATMAMDSFEVCPSDRTIMRFLA